MKKLSLLVIAFAMATGASAQKYLPPFLDEKSCPVATEFIADPPKPFEGAFYDDFYYYNWGKEQRKDDKVREQAVHDYVYCEPDDLLTYFSEAFGMELSREKTPEIAILTNRADGDAYKANKQAKNHWQRTRPFVTFGEESLTPDTDEKNGKSYSYPSGHSICAYTVAMTLALINPDATERLLKAANYYALERVICGHHYKSDTVAAFQLATATILKLSGNADFQHQLAKAKKEARK